MATLKRSDILRKHSSRGRPPKPEKERQLKQRAAYQWRDARRIYLAGSFERWRKLRSRLQLKDSSLAWHLLETHDKGCYNCSLQGVDGEESRLMGLQHDTADLPTKDASKFYPELLTTLRRLCHTYLHFEECVELVGLVCVETDHKTKDTYSIKELVKRGLLPKQRTHERQQAELEASEAKFVAAVLSRSESEGNQSGLSDTQHPPDSKGLRSEASSICGDTSMRPAADEPQVPNPSSVASSQSPQGRSNVMDTESGVSNPAEASPSSSACRPESDAGVSCPPQRQHEEDARSQCQRSEPVRPGHETTPTHSLPYRSYDETDHSGQTGSLQRKDHDGSALIRNKSRAAPNLWQSQCQDECVYCRLGESHKVVVSDDGVVSHVVHNGPALGQVYRIDLSNRSEENEVEMDEDLPVGEVRSREEVHISNEESMDRAASIESSDSFMEVGIVSKINHAQHLLASPTHPASPASFPVSDQTPPPDPDPDPYPPPSPDHTSARVSLSSDPTHLHAEASLPHPTHLHAETPPSHPSQTSVIKEVFNPQHSAAVKTEPTSSASNTFSTGNVTAARNEASVDDGDLPLDMSLVKDEADNNADDADLPESTSGRQREKAVHDSQQPCHDSQDAGRTSASPARSTASETATSSESYQVSSASSSMQLLQHYTERLMQQQLNLERPSQLSALHGSPLTVTDSGDDPSRARKRKLSDLDDRSDAEPGRGVPWPRKDMTQKEEYQFLETDPFMDFAEMSRLFPNMQQRTFYRWKRRIKDQFICLEQQPTLTYAQFSQYFPQVKDHVFEHWRGLIAKGHRFLGDAAKSGASFGDVKGVACSVVKACGEEGVGSGGHKEGEGGAQPDDYISQYIFLQKNLSLDAEQFSQVFPEVPQHLFYLWKKQIFSDFLKLQANPKVNYQEFRKQASVTQDVFSLWKAHLTLMSGPGSLMTSCAGLVSSQASLSTAAPTLPPVSLLAARAGSKGMGADLAAWYASYAPLMGQMALPFWSPLNIMSSPPLPTSLPSLRDSNSSADRERDHESLPRDQPAQEEQGEKDPSVRRKASASDSLKTKDAGGVSTEEKGGDAKSPSPHASEGGGEGAIGYRGRRQSLKPEHYYYLLHPDTPYATLTQLFPGVSAQRYGRWRRKVSSALALLEREPHCTSEHFALSFPNVPDEILSSWRDRVKHGHARLMVGGPESGEDPTPPSATAPATSSSQPPTSPSPALSGQHSRDSSLGAEVGSAGEDAPNFLLAKSREVEGEKAAKEDRYKDHSLRESPALLSSRRQFKMNREEFHFVQRYPNVDFATFASYYPSISVRTFYRWRRQIRDSIDLLRSRPAITLLDFQKLVPEVTEDVFEAWRLLVKEEARMQRERSTDTPEGDGADGHVSADGSVPSTSSGQLQQPKAETAPDEMEGSGQCRPEQWLVHMNPNLDYSELSRTYPSISQRTFYRWKQEVRQVMDYMRDRPDVRYDDIASVLPEVSHEAFLMWQHLLTVEKLSQQSTGKVEAESTVQPRESLPEPSSSLLADTSAESVLRSGASDTRSRDGMASVPGNLAMSEGVEQHVGMLGMEEEESASSKARRQTRDEFIHVMLNPAMDYAEFARRFGTVSQRTFYRWRAHIRDWRAAIRADPHLDYATFSRTARDVPESVFRVWRDWESRLENPHNSSASYDSYEGAQHDPSQSGTGQSLPLQAARSGSASVSSDLWKNCHPHTSQLEVLCSAYDYYQRHSDIQFDGLAAQFPSVTVDVFQQWKKGVDMKLEYIRSIPTTNFDDFHSLFPDVKEDIFDIWKAKVLSQAPAGENFLFPQSASSESSSPLPVPQPAFPASSHNSSHSFYPQTAAVYTGSSTSRPDEAPGSHYSLHGTSGKSPLPSAYKSRPSHSPRLQSSPARASEEVLDKEDMRTVRVKVETSATTPLPSFTETVSNLGRLSAMVQHRLPQAKQAASTLASPPTLHYSHTSVIASAPPSLSGSFSTALAGIVGHGLAKTSAAAAGHSSAAGQASADHAHFQPDSQAYSTASQPGTGDCVSSAQPPVEEPDAGMPEGSLPGPAREEVEGVGEGAGGPESLVYSSQRQRKLQRVEYMFVEQNPDVDVQEFLNRFPKVSLRTFYRWKREIREEQQAGGSNGATL